MNKTVSLAVILLLSVSPCSAEISAECRGLAAGVVSEMKNDLQIKEREMMLVALKAARRACTAAVDGLVMTDPPVKDEAEQVKDDEKGKMALTEFLTQQQEKKAGNKRLDRLKN